MKKLIPMLMLVFSLAVPTCALEIEAPKVPNSASELMPEDCGSFSDALIELLQTAFLKVRPDLFEAVHLCLRIVCVVLILAIMASFRDDGSIFLSLSGAVCISVLLLGSANSMLSLAEDTIHNLSGYGKLLLPVMTAALAAQGGTASSAGLYLGTVFFDTVLSNLLCVFFLPLVYFFVIFSVTYSATSEDFLKKIRDTIKNLTTWCLKTILTIFTTYMGITGVVSGTTDAATLKAAKITISSFVPVVGGILSDASESILVGAGVMKNAAGIYGILAVLSLVIEPFLKIGIHYMILKATGILCTAFGTKSAVTLIEDFSGAMGLLLAMTGSMCLLILISTVCFMKGVS